MAVACVAAVVASRLLAAIAVAAACGIPHPLAADLLAVPALELAGVVPLTPANAGVAGGAAALAFHLAGAEPAAALAAGLVLHAVETATSVLAGAASALYLLRRGRLSLRGGRLVS